LAILTLVADARRVFLQEKRLPIRWVNKYHEVRYRRALKRTLARYADLPPIPCDPQADTELHMLTCIYDLDMAVAALKSLLRFNPGLAVVIHGDRTLGIEHRNFLEAQIPGCRVILLEEADQLISQDDEFASIRKQIPGRFTLPDGYERQCAAWALKVLDFYALANTDKVMVLDSDTLFISRPTELLDWIAGNGESAFHSAPSESNAQLSSDIVAAGFPGLSYPQKFNGGLFGYSRTMVSRELVLQVLRTLLANPEWPLYGDECIWRLILGYVPKQILPFANYPLIARVGPEARNLVDFDHARYVHFIIKHRSGFYQRIARKVLAQLESDRCTVCSNLG